jgi:hypothetical protein
MLSLVVAIWKRKKGKKMVAMARIQQTSDNITKAKQKQRKQNQQTNKQKTIKRNGK